MSVAAAAPEIPHLKPAIKTASKMMFKVPEIIDTAKPSRGFSATIKKELNKTCSINTISPASRILPYSTQ